MKRGALILLLTLQAAAAVVQVRSIEPGAVLVLDGTWEYRPGFQQQYVSVPVPQMLSRIASGVNS